jgi:hypothetical protein
MVSKGKIFPPLTLRQSNPCANTANSVKAMGNSPMFQHKIPKIGLGLPGTPGAELQKMLTIFGETANFVATKNLRGNAWYEIRFGLSRFSGPAIGVCWETG